MKTPALNIRLFIVLALCIVTFICFNYTMHNEFTNWDDDFYVTHDQYITALTPHNLKVIFTEDITKNNYHPLCMLSLAFNYYFSQLNPQAYYLTNICIHIANVVLVFLLLLQLGSMLKFSENAKMFIATLAALWFGIHPMHVESVSWIAERKDVLYAFFYIAGLITYLKYIGDAKKKWYIITLLLFVASCLSKPMAVVFPLSLLCVDFLLQRKLGKRLIMEKAVFFLISLICGSMAFYTQNKTGAIASFDTLTVAQRLMFASYGYVMYVSKVFNPTYLSTFYPYPYRYTSGYFTAIYYAAPFLSVAILAVPLYFSYKMNKTYFRIAAFGLGFLTANLIFVLQFISVGAAIMADRYSYVAYIGFFFMLAYFIQEIINKLPAFKNAIYLLVGAVSIFFGFLCHERTLVWHNAETLLTDAIEKYPYRALLSYKWRGNYYFDQGEYDKALEDYGVLTTLHAADAKVEDKIMRINLIKGTMGNGGLNSTKLMPGDNSYKPALDSSYTYCQKGDTVNAFKTYISALRHNVHVEKTYADSSFRAVQAQQYTSAINQYNVLLKINTSNPYYYFYRGVAMFGQSKVRSAISDWEIALQMNAKDVQQSASYNLSVAYDTLGKDSMAVYYAQMAKEKGYTVNAEFMTKLQKRKQSQAHTH